MKKSFMKKLLLVFASIFLALGIFSACTPKQKIRISYVNWAEGVAMSNLAAVIIEENFDIGVDLLLADAGVVYASLATGDSDFFMDVWLPVTHQNYLEQYGDRLVEMTTLYDEARLGLAVPTYLTDINTIDDFVANAESFDNKITGIDSGAGIMTAARAAIEDYDMDGVELLESSEAAMIAALETAIRNEEPIAITAWTPHYRFAANDLKFLEDPNKSFGEVEQVYLYSRLEFETDHPEIAKLLKNMHFTPEILNPLMQLIADNPNTNEKQLVADWAKEPDNKAIIDSWLAAA